MGEFDRQQKPETKSQSKQLAICIALGAVLIGVLGFHFMKQGPATAMAGTDGTIPLPTLDETPEHAVATLTNKASYENLLRGSTIEPPEFARTPRNAFLMDRAWRSELNPEAQVVVQVVDPETTEIVQVPVPVAPLPLVKIENYKLGSIMQSNGKYSAIVNGHIVTAGMLLDSGARVVDITAERVLLQHPNSAKAPTAELKMDRKLN